MDEKVLGIHPIWPRSVSKDPLIKVTTRKMVFGDKQLLSPNLFILSLESLGDEHGCVTLSWSLKVLVTNYFVIEWLYITKTKQLVMHMFRHLLFSSPNVLSVDKIFCQQIFLFYFFIFLLSYRVTILFHHLQFSSPKALCGDKIFHHQLFLFY